MLPCVILYIIQKYKNTKIPVAQLPHGIFEIFGIFLSLFSSKRIILLNFTQPFNFQFSKKKK